jgi:hypothetical protein
LKSTKYAIDTTSKPAKNTADDVLLAEKSKLEQDLRIAKENEIKLQQDKFPDGHPNSPIFGHPNSPPVGVNLTNF